ncbi:hypothetical protein BSU04_22730 [Caballeronia sordidicola]|jgi:hypothetical protein|uniref:Uncharacterized protein n=1 Tax=Caballeronia sordidicola TaxID=196367 RepID=A0A226WYM1_CABSO|nr:hypothetical protein BSU04_22730 [Caballeronia sordidicola]
MKLARQWNEPSATFPLYLGGISLGIGADDALKMVEQTEV